MRSRSTKHDRVKKGPVAEEAAAATETEPAVKFSRLNRPSGIGDAGWRRPGFDAGSDAAGLLFSSVVMTEPSPLSRGWDRLATLMRWLGADSRGGAAKERAIATLRRSVLRR